MEMYPKSWLQMGAELEGSWTRKREEIAAMVRGAKAVRDDSVHIGFGDPGEIITRPHDDIDALCNDILAMYPDHLHPTCGFHIHVSFTPMVASMIATQEFYQYFKNQWHIWGKKEKLPNNHEFWARLSGSNKNTRDEFVPEVQLKGDGKGRGYKGTNSSARYTMLNFYSWEIHRTIECRLLPMFLDREQAIRAVKHLAWIYDSYSATHGFSAVVIDAATQVRGDRAVETYEYNQPVLEPMSFNSEGELPELLVGENVFYSIAGAMDDMLPYALNNKETP